MSEVSKGSVVALLLCLEPGQPGWAPDAVDRRFALSDAADEARWTLTMAAAEKRVAGR